jgi:hypothetical protein
VEFKVCSSGLTVSVLYARLRGSILGSPPAEARGAVPVAGQ